MIRSLPESAAHDALRGYVALAYTESLGSGAATDEFLHRWFRLHPGIAFKARAFVASAVYALLRARMATCCLMAWADREPPPADAEVPIADPRHEGAAALLRWLMVDCGAPAEKAYALAIQAFLSVRQAGHSDAVPADLPVFLLAFANRVRNDQDLRRLPPFLLRVATASVTPEYLRRQEGLLGEEAAFELALSLRVPAPLCLRINRTHADREAILRTPGAKVFLAQRARWSPDGLVLGVKKRLSEWEGLKPGDFEIQDEGSQLISCAVAPERGGRVLDACAGEGGKTIALADLMGGSGAVIAHDLDAGRMAGLAGRAERARLSNVQVIAPGTAAAHGPYDAVLIDAPCLGLGRARRDPAVMWRGGSIADRLPAMTAAQGDCVREYARLVRPGGVLVYATCSTEPEETTGILAGLGDDFAGEALPGPFDQTGFPRAASNEQHRCVLLPSTHGTDGFFVARFRRLRD